MPALNDGESREEKRQRAAASARVQIDNVAPLNGTVNPLLTFALEYATRGWWVFPLRFGVKISHKSAEHSDGRRWGMTTDPEEILLDAKRWPNANIGIAMGAETGAFVLETDTMEGHDVDGGASLAALEAEHGVLPETRQAISPSGSIHYYFNHPGFKIKNSVSVIGLGIDIKGDGGMVVAPPSVVPPRAAKGDNPASPGGVYRWLNEPPMADAPQWLLDRILAGKETPEPENDTQETGAEFDAIYGGRHQKYAAIAMDNMIAELAGRVPGSRNAALNSTAYKLGQMSARLWIDEAIPLRRIRQACVTNGLLEDTSEQAVEATIASGLGGGRANPHPDLPDRYQAGTETVPIRLDTLKSWWRDPTTIPKRCFLDRERHYCRGAIGATIAAGGRGKTTRCVYEAISFALGYDLFTKNPLPEGALRVLILNGEEDQDELDRRVAACCQRYGVIESDLGGRLFIKSVRDKPLRIASLVNNRPVIDQSVRDTITGFVGYNSVDVFMIDPLVSFHGVTENDNTHMDLVIKEGFGSIASNTNSVGELFHHPGKPKPGQAESTVEDGRGASAILWAVRSARVLNFMTEVEATKLGIHEDDRRLHVRITNGKANMGPLGKAKWMKLYVESLSNGDEIACAEPWTQPNAFDGLTVKDMELAQKLAGTGEYRTDMRSPDWFGYALAAQLHIDVFYGAQNNIRDVARVKTLIKTWLKSGALQIEKRKDSASRERDFIVPGNFKDTAAMSDDEID
jgi:hypothetical protein